MKKIIKKIKWSVEYFQLVEFSKDSFNHWLSVMLNKENEEYE